MPTVERRFDFAGIILAVVGLFLALVIGLIPGLLAALGAFALTSWLSGTAAMWRLRGLRKPVSAAIVIVLPAVVLIFAGVELGRFASAAAQNYAGLIDHLVGVSRDWGARLPEALGVLLPTEKESIQDLIKSTMKNHAPMLAGVGRSWIGGLVFVVVGLIIGALMAVSVRSAGAGPLTVSLRERGGLLLTSFKKVVLAQFWIAAINASLTAVLLFVAFPFFDVKIPYAGWLVVLTFVAGLLPIVGNLICNAVLTLAGLGVGPHIALVCLIFLVAIHKLEYFINAKVLGSQIQTSVWELLIVMFLFEAVFGVVGLVAAPLYYAYLKLELIRLQWI